MRPTPIPDDEIWEGARRIVVSPPGGDLTNTEITPVEALVDPVNDGIPRLSCRCVLEEGDLDRLRAGGVVWVSFYGGQMIPWSIDVAGSVSPTRPSLRVDVTLDGPDGPRFDTFIEGVALEGAERFVAGVIEALQEQLRQGLSKRAGN